MKKLAALLTSLIGLAALSGCVAYPVGYENRPQYRQVPERGANRDRDGDGVPNRYDRRPGNPYQY